MIVKACFAGLLETVGFKDNLINYMNPTTQAVKFLQISVRSSPTVKSGIIRTVVGLFHVIMSCAPGRSLICPHPCSGFLHVNFDLGASFDPASMILIESDRLFLKWDEDGFDIVEEPSTSDYDQEYDHDFYSEGFASESLLDDHESWNDLWKEIKDDDERAYFFKKLMKLFTGRCDFTYTAVNACKLS